MCSSLRIEVGGLLEKEQNFGGKDQGIYLDFETVNLSLPQKL